MSARVRALVALLLALLVALPLLPAALDDDDVVATDDVVEVDVVDDTGPTTSTTTTTTSTEPPASSSSTSTSTSTTTSTTSTTTSIPDDGGSTGTTPKPPPTTKVSLSVAPAGELVEDREGTIVATATSTRTSTDTLTVTVDITGGAVSNAPSECTRTLTAARCQFNLGAGESRQLPITVAVNPGAASVAVTVSAIASLGVDPPSVSASFPTTSNGLPGRFAASGALDVAVLGNTLASCGDGTTNGATTCESVRAGTAPDSLDNDDWTMVEFRMDTRGSGSSSSAVLDGVATTDVRAAYLVWGASTTGATPASAGTIKFVAGTTPEADGDYSTVTASEVVEAPGAWQSVADVTDVVSAAGADTYWTADIASDLGAVDAWAGWALIVVYESSEPGSRSILIVDGLVDPTTGYNVAFSGGATAPTHLGLVAWDGDAGDGDEAFDSTIEIDGAPVNPAFVNALGIDVDSFTALPGPSLTSTAGSVRIEVPDDDVLVGVVVLVS